MSAIDLNTVDVDGAVREAEEAVAGDTRASFFKKAAIGGGAVAGAGFFTGMLPAIAQGAPSKRQDISILNYALTLEFLEAEFYERADGISGRQRAIARLLTRHEKIHVRALQATIRDLGGNPVNKPTFDFKNTNKGNAFIETAFVLENTGTRAYIGQAPRLKSKALLTVAGQILAVEARHAAAIAVLKDDSPISDKRKGGITPFGPFDRASSMGQILGEVNATGFIQG